MPPDLQGYVALMATNLSFEPPFSNLATHMKTMCFELFAVSGHICGYLSS